MNPLSGVEEMQQTPPVMLPSIPVHQHVHHHMYHYDSHQRPSPRMHHVHISLHSQLVYYLFLYTLHLNSLDILCLMHPVLMNMQQGPATHDMIPFSSLTFPEFLQRQMSARLDNYMRIVDLRRMAQTSCGATQESIESHTFPHKYKRVSI